MVTFANGLSEVQCNIVLYYTHFSEFNQTKRRHHRTYTVDEADALGLAIPLPQGAMGAVGRHGNCSERSPKLGGGDFRTAVRCDTWYYSTYRTVETERTSENPPLTGTYAFHMVPVDYTILHLDIMYYIVPTHRYQILSVLVYIVRTSKY